ncbi:MAG: hypothetical protein PVH59_12995 [Anaerolineae bacterium]|jgi:ribosomal protein L37AE/L43A
MKQQGKKPSWSPRVPRHKIRRLYEQDAKGIHNEELVDDVGFTLLSRCTSFIEANRAVRGQAPCPICGHLVSHQGNQEETLACEQCGWELTWGEYFGTIQKKQLSGAEPVIRLFEQYVREFPVAKSYQARMYLIDWLIHGFHWHQKYGTTRPVAVNLIDGRLSDVIEFLDNLSYGKESSPGLQEKLEEWKEQSEYVRSWARN